MPWGNYQQMLKLTHGIPVVLQSKIRELTINKRYSNKLLVE